MKAKATLIVLAALLLALLAAPIGAQQSGIVVAWPQEINSLNPLYTTQTFAGYTYQLFLAPAWNYDAELELNPVLVSEIPSIENGGISEDGTTFTLSLNEGIVWSDGDPLTSADFLFTYEMVMAPENAALTTSPWDRIGSIEAPDDTTVVVSFDEAYAPWAGLFSYVLPEHILRPIFEADGTLQDAPFNTNPTVSSGPYVPDQVDITSFIRFVANENFVGGTPSIQTLIVEFVPDEQAYVANLVAGETHIGTFVPFAEVPGLEAAGLTVEILPSGYNEGWFVNVGDGGHPALKDVRVREAISMGFDFDAVNRDLNLGATFTPSGYWENTPYDSPNVQPSAFDQARARELLDEAGWVVSGDPLVEGGDGLREMDGTPLELRFSATTRQIRQDILALAQQQLGQLGIRILIESHPGNVFFAGFADGGPVATGQYDLAQWSSSVDSFPDPDTTRFTCAQIPSAENPTGGNWSFYCNPELDELFELQATQADIDDRVATFHQIDEVLGSQFIWIGVWHDADVWITNPVVENTNLNGVTPFWNVANWTLAQ
jgi:peptide/nickel transport system substrate-binding protein